MERAPHDDRERTAWDLRLRHNWLQSFTDDELRRISLCAEEEVLQPSDHYFDISHPERGVIHAHMEQRAPEGSCYVARSRVEDELWHKLLAVHEERGREVA